MLSQAFAFGGSFPPKFLTCLSGWFWDLSLCPAFCSVYYPGYCVIGSLFLLGSLMVSQYHLNNNSITPSSPWSITDGQKNNYHQNSLPYIAWLVWWSLRWGTSWLYSGFINVKYKHIWLTSFQKSMCPSRFDQVPLHQQSGGDVELITGVERCHSSQKHLSSAWMCLTQTGTFQKVNGLIWNKTTQEFLLTSLFLLGEARALWRAAALYCCFWSVFLNKIR